MPSKEVITFHAADRDADDTAILKFITWAGEDTVEDLGICDDWHRYRVDAGLWSQYVREKTRR
jgi:hypothetical protein